MKYGKAGAGETVITAKDIIIATGSIPLVPKGIEVDGKYSCICPCVGTCCSSSVNV